MTFGFQSKTQSILTWSVRQGCRFGWNSEVDIIQGLKKRCLSVEGRPTTVVVTGGVDGAGDICLVSPAKVGGSGGGFYLF